MGLLHSAAKKSEKVLVFVYRAMLSPVFELKQFLKSQPYPYMNSLPPKRVELLWSSMGKIISSPLLTAITVDFRYREVKGTL